MTPDLLGHLIRRARRLQVRNLISGGFVAALLLASTSVPGAPDYQREKRWADEITPAIVVGDPVYLLQQNGHKFLAIYTEAAKAKMGVIVVHGIGVHPDWGMIGTLRQSLADHGYSTLSVQMPVLAAAARTAAYDAILPDAVDRLELAFAFLRGKGYRRIAIVSHSAGSRMAYAYMKRNAAEIAAWAALGVPAAPGGPGTTLSYGGFDTPVLDLYGSNDLPQVVENAALRRASLQRKANSRQIVIAGSDHFYAGHEAEMVNAVTEFLDSLK